MKHSTITLKRGVHLDALRPDGTTYAIIAKALTGTADVLDDGSMRILAYQARDAAAGAAPQKHEIGEFSEEWEVIASRVSNMPVVPVGEARVQRIREAFWSHNNRHPLILTIPVNNIDGFVA